VLFHKVKQHFLFFSADFLSSSFWDLQPCRMLPAALHLFRLVKCCIIGLTFPSREPSPFKTGYILSHLWGIIQLTLRVNKRSPLIIFLYSTQDIMKLFSNTNLS